MTQAAFSHPEADEREFEQPEFSSPQKSTERKVRAHHLPTIQPPPAPVERPGKVRALSLFKRIHQAVEAA